MIPSVRNVEVILPDYVPEAKAKPELVEPESTLEVVSFDSDTDTHIQRRIKI